MSKNKSSKNHKFRDKLILNQWLISLFGIDPLSDKLKDQNLRPFHRLAEIIKDPQLEGLDHDNLHHFYHALVHSHLFEQEQCRLSKNQILHYEENIVRYTLSINENRNKPIVWKYFQWLSLLFVEIYLDLFFNHEEQLLNDLNNYIKRFNSYYKDYTDIPLYNDDELNKLCLQNATGSGKTLLMHINVLQYRHYAKNHGKAKDLSRIILLTPNEALSYQHIVELKDSGISADLYMKNRGSLFGIARGLEHVDVLEITKLADQDGPNTTSARSLGDQNLLIVDEGHRGLSGNNKKEFQQAENAWFRRRSQLCAKGFTFEYSSTFEQAVQAAGDIKFENSYAKTVLFDYSYRWFYEDGFGKDYQILNLPESFEELQAIYLTACLLKFYQQLRIYEDKSKILNPFNLEKPLWVFVGSTVSAGKKNQDEQLVASDVTKILQFIADFLSKPKEAQNKINEILTSNGQDTGLLDKEDNDIFAGSFSYLASIMNIGENVSTLYKDILFRIFQNSSGGKLVLRRIKGDSGEIALYVGTSETPFGLINVGEAKSLCDHVSSVSDQDGTRLTIEDSIFTEPMFASVKDSASPINLLIGSKKFVEGWDCWRVSTMGLMHVGKNEGSQILQLFGRGIRLKGYNNCLKRSGHSYAPERPNFIEELETLNVFGIEANFMEKFREFLKTEGLPGNERRRTITIPLNLTYNFGKKLKVLRPKLKDSDGKEYDFKKDAPTPIVGDVPEYMKHNTVVADWYPRIRALQSRQTSHFTQKDKVNFPLEFLDFLDCDRLYFELEQFKQERSWYNLNITKEGIINLLSRNDWYTLYFPEARLKPKSFDGILTLQQIAIELLRKYCDHYYNYCKRKFIEPRLELRELSSFDDNIPQDEMYKLIVNGDEEQVIQSIFQMKEELEKNKHDVLKVGDLNVCNFKHHLYQPLFHVRRGGKISVHPISLNESEYRFVEDLRNWCENNTDILNKNKSELFLLRNMSRGKGVGFFEAGNFYPDFILWIIRGNVQFINFIEPHGLKHEGSGAEKIKFSTRIKNLESRLNDPNVILNSFILSWTLYHNLKWDKTKDELEDLNVLFMNDDINEYIDKLYAKIH